MCEHGKYVLMNMEVEIDECLAPLIKMLQKHGIKTRSCCCGHGQKRDGKKINNNLIVSAEGGQCRNKKQGWFGKWMERCF